MQKVLQHEGRSSKAVHKGSVPSTLPWNLILDSLMAFFNEVGFCTILNPDHSTILFSDRFGGPPFELMPTELQKTGSRSDFSLSTHEDEDGTLHKGREPRIIKSAKPPRYHYALLKK